MADKREFDPNFFRRLIPLLFLAVFLFFLFLAALVFQPFLMAAFLAAILFILFRNFYYYLQEKYNGHDTLAALTTCFIVLTAFTLPLVFVIFTLSQELQYLYQYSVNLIDTFNYDLLYQHYQEPLTRVGIRREHLEQIPEKILEWSRESSLSLLVRGQTIVGEVLRILSNFFLALIILFFFFKNGQQIATTLDKNIPFSDHIKKEMGERIMAVFDAVVRGNILIAIFQGFVVGFLFWIFGLDTPVFYGVVGVFFGLIPVIGTSILWAPATVVLYFQSSILIALLFGSLAFGAYFILENIAKPLMLDKKLKLHPLILLMSLLGGLAEFGIKGLILGPFAVTIFLTTWHLIKIWNTTNDTI